MTMNNLQREKFNLSLFSIGMFISVFGSTIYTFAIGLYVLELTKSGMSFAITLMSGVISTIVFNPIAGVLVDRFNKKKLILAMDISNGALYFLLFFISKYYGLSLGVIYLSTFITTGLTTIFGIAINTAKPEIVTNSNLLRINVIENIINSVASIIGPAVGGVIFAFVNIELFILVNAISFVISVIIESMIDFSFNYKVIDSKNDSFHFIDDLRMGIKYIISSKDIKTTIGLLTAVNFFISISITVPLPYIMNQVLALDSNSYGIVESFFPVGMILGAMGIKYVMKKFEYKQLLKSSIFCLSIIMFVTGLPLFVSIIFSDLVYLLYYCFVMFLLGVTVSFIDIPITYYLQTEIPSEVRGRVISIGIAGAKIIAPIGLLLSGMLLENIATYLLPSLSGSVLFVGTFLCLNFLGEKRGSLENKAMKEKNVDDCI